MLIPAGSSFQENEEWNLGAIRVGEMPRCNHLRTVRGSTLANGLNRHIQELNCLSRATARAGVIVDIWLYGRHRIAHRLEHQRSLKTESLGQSHHRLQCSPRSD